MIGLVPPVAVAVPESVTKASREFVAAARLGTEFTRSLSNRISRRHPSRVVLEYNWGAMSIGSAKAAAASVSPSAAISRTVVIRRAIMRPTMRRADGYWQTTEFSMHRQKSPQETVQSTDTESRRRTKMRHARLVKA
ncbi:Uncharacterised protein [Mycobacteroides abscessus subsp. abscessus]|nr:Uncharacterised protein [Mycobacteroides abscessus subsp. abscessus]